MKTETEYTNYITQFEDAQNLTAMEIVENLYAFHMGIQIAHNVSVSMGVFDKTKQTLYNHAKALGLISNRRKDIQRVTMAKEIWELSDNPHEYNPIAHTIGMEALADCWHIDFKRATAKALSTAHHASRMLTWTMTEYMAYCKDSGEAPTREGINTAVILLGIITHPRTRRIYHIIWHDNKETQSRVERLIMLATQHLEKGERLTRVVIDRDTNEELAEVWAKHGITQIHMGKTVKLPYGAWAEQPFSNIAKTMYAQRSGICPTCEAESGNPTQILRQKDNRTEIREGVYAVTCKRCGHEMIVFEWKEMEMELAIEMFRALVEVFYYKRMGRIMRIAKGLSEAVKVAQLIPIITEKRQ